MERRGYFFSPGKRQEQTGSFATWRQIEWPNAPFFGISHGRSDGPSMAPSRRCSCCREGWLGRKDQQGTEDNGTSRYEILFFATPYTTFALVIFTCHVHKSGTGLCSPHSATMYVLQISVLCMICRLGQLYVCITSGRECGREGGCAMRLSSALAH